MWCEMRATECKREVYRETERDTETGCMCEKESERSRMEKEKRRDRREGIERGREIQERKEKGQDET